VIFVDFEWTQKVISAAKIISEENNVKHTMLI